MEPFKVWLDIQYDKSDLEEKFQIPIFLTVPRFPVIGDIFFVMDEEELETGHGKPPNCWEMSVTQVQFSHGESNIAVQPTESTPLWSMEDCDAFSKTISAFSPEYAKSLMQKRIPPIVL